MSSPRCKSCGRDVYWVTIAGSGRRMPLDRSPDPEKGNVRITKWGNDPRAVVLSRSEIAKLPDAAAVPLYRSHFSTCPNATSHRSTARRPRETDAPTDSEQLGFL